MSPLYLIYEPIEVLRRKYSDYSVYHRIDKLINKELNVTMVEDYVDDVVEDKYLKTVG